ncbi:MAG: DUF1349 domain-containing protein [Candidatus Jacksonbacteria bacterium]|jgi:hypothetical protein|nr:DUF1349 domain-containing protein [Candidatus Neomarinimicrobiota bacterium]MBT6757660.1 DUF1349 domain-containing protein [Candidatus Jacksonbacteria bacterium]
MVKLTTWINEPVVPAVESENAITITADKKSDFFRDPGSDFRVGNAHIYAIEAGSEFSFECRVKPTFTSEYDAGSIMFYASEEQWIKFAFENTDLGHTAVVAVVTSGVSDDSNGEVIIAESVYLKLSRKQNLFSLCYSLDGVLWRMVRLFRFDISADANCFVGVEAQSPVGEGCRVEFSDINYSSNAPKDMRKGV